MRNSRGRWGDDWQPLKRGVDALAEAEAPPLERSMDSSAMADAAPLERGAPATTAEEHAGWRRFVDRVRASAAEFWRDESSGVPEGATRHRRPVVRRGLAAVRGHPGRRGRRVGRGRAAIGGAGDGSDRGQVRQQARERVRRERASRHPESRTGASRSVCGRVLRPCCTMSVAWCPMTPGDPFERLAAEWAQAPAAGRRAAGFPQPPNPTLRSRKARTSSNPQPKERYGKALDRGRRHAARR